MRNAFAHCHTHHWAFDLRLWSATDDLTVMVARPDARRGDDLDAVREFDGSTLRLPDLLSPKPHPLAWHRDVRFGRAA